MTVKTAPTKFLSALVPALMFFCGLANAQDTVSDLELHLKLDGNGNDATGGAGATLSAGVSYVDAAFGQGLGFDQDGAGAQHASVAGRAGLQFGASQDFTVSLWVRGWRGVPSDPAILANKDWGPGNKPGWIIATGSDGRWQWNVSDGSNRADYDGPAGRITDDRWHHLLVSHDRDGDAVLYYDGVEVARRDISNIGDIGNSLPVTVGL